MRPQRSGHSRLFLIAGLLFAGCVGTDEELKYLGKADLHYYRDVMEEIQYAPVVGSETQQEAQMTEEPRRLGVDRRDTPWKMTLMEAIHTALANNHVIRQDGTFLSPGNPVYTNPNGVDSIYDPAIQETGVLFGGRGVAAALADFDTTFSTSMVWGRSEAIQNNIFFGGGLRPGTTLQTDTGTFQSALSKQFADSGSITIGHNWNYLYANLPGQLFPSSYTGNLQAQYRRPLWAGSGAEYTRIAGPRNANFGAITGVSQGVVIARINNDITLAEFEASVRDLVKDVENVYWELYLRYQQYHTAVVTRESARRAWKRAKDLDELGGPANARKQDEPQARDAYYQAKAAAETALSDIYNTETRLRRLLGLKVNDNFVIQPIDEPAMGEIDPLWDVSLSEALVRRVELRRQKWNIKSLELQLKAAKSLTNPRLDFVSSYQVNGFGDRLFGQNDNDGTTAQGLHSAYETLTQGNQTAWTLGFQFSMPLGFRSAHSQVRNIELRLLKARKLLATQELEISHELAVAFQNLARHYANMKTNYERIFAARDRTKVLQNLLEAKIQPRNQPNVLDEYLRALQAQALAENAFYTSVTQYNQSIAELEYRKGSLLEYNAISLAESEWTPQAYQQALRRAWARSHAFDHDKLLHTEPPAFVPLDMPSLLPYCEPGQEPELQTPPKKSPPVPPAPADGEKKESGPQSTGPNDDKSATAANTRPGALKHVLAESRGNAGNQAGPPLPPVGP